MKMTYCGKITYSEAKRYAIKLIENHKNKLPIRKILLEIAVKYNPVITEAHNFKPEVAAAFIKKEEPAFYNALLAVKNDLVSSPTIGANYGPYIRGIVNLIMQFAANNLPDDPNDFVQVGNFALNNLNTELEKETEKTTVVNMPPKSTVTSPTAVESFNSSLSFKKFLDQEELQESIKYGILKKVILENNINTELYNEIFGSIASGISSMFGGRKIPKRVGATHDQKVVAWFGQPEKMNQALDAIFSGLIANIQSKKNIQKFGNAMGIILPQIIKGLQNEKLKAQKSPLEYFKSIASEKTFVSQKDTKKGLIYSLFGGKSGAEKAAMAIAEQKNEQFVSYMQMFGLEEDGIKQTLAKLSEMTLIEFQQFVSQGMQKLDNRRKEQFINFMKDYEESIKKVFRSQPPEEQKQSDAAITDIKKDTTQKVGISIAKLGNTFKTNKLLGMGILAALLFSMTMKMQTHHGLDADSGNRAKTSMVQKTPDGTGPDDYSAGQSGDLQRHIDGVAETLEMMKNSGQFGGEMAGEGELLKKFVDNAYSAGDTSPENLAEFLEGNPGLSDFLNGLNINNLADITKALEKAQSMGLDLEKLTQQLNDIANKPAPSSSEPEAAQGSFKQFAQSKSSGSSKATGPTKIIKDRIHGGTAEVPKKGLVGSLGQALFGPKNVKTGEKANRGILGALNPKNWKKGR